MTPFLSSKGTIGSNGRLLYPILLRTSPQGKSSVSPVGTAFSFPSITYQYYRIVNIKLLAGALWGRGARGGGGREGKGMKGEVEIREGTPLMIVRL